MAARTFIVAKGRINELAQRVADGANPANAGFFIAYYQGTIQADNVLETHLTKTAVDAGNAIATFTNYSTDASRLLANVSQTISGTEVYADANDLTITTAGGTTNNTITRAILYYTPDTTAITNATSVPLVHYQFDVTTTGVDLTFEIGAGGLYVTG